MKKLPYSLLIIIFSVCFLCGFASCPLNIEQPPKVETFIPSIENEGIQEFEYVNVTTGEHVFLSCVYDDQRDNLPATVLPIAKCNNIKGTRMEQAASLENYCLDQATRLAVCKKHPKQCK